MLYDETDTLQKNSVREKLHIVKKNNLDENTQYTRYLVVYNNEAQSAQSNTDTGIHINIYTYLQYGGSKTDTTLPTFFRSCKLWRTLLWLCWRM